jgi:hypothetical protein
LIGGDAGALAGLVDAGAGGLPDDVPATTGTADGGGVFTVGSSERASSSLVTGDWGVDGAFVGA